MTDAMPTSPVSDVPPAHHLLAMMFGHVQTHLLRVAAQLRLADLLQGGPKPLAALAEATGTDAAALARVLGALTALGLVVETEAQQFISTPLGDLLRSDTPDSLRSYALLIGSEWLTRPWPSLLESVQTGTSAFAQVFGMPLYAYLQHHPEAAAVFDDALTAISQQEALALREAYDFAAVRTLVDVGGGVGSCWQRCCKPIRRCEACCSIARRLWPGPRRCSSPPWPAVGVRSRAEIFSTPSLRGAICIYSNAFCRRSTMRKRRPSSGTVGRPWRQGGASSWRTRIRRRSMAASLIWACW